MESLFVRAKLSNSLKGNLYVLVRAKFSNSLKDIIWKMSSQQKLLFLNNIVHYCLNINQ